jgi:hypothetical protein
LAALASGSEKQKVLAANLLSLVAPDEAVSGIVAILPRVKSEVRADLRTALGKAARAENAKGAVEGALSNAELPLVATLDLLRVMAPRAQSSAAAKGAFTRLATPTADFRTRFLLLSPAAALAREGSAEARSFLFGAATSDADGHVRARAVEVLAEVPSSQEPLARALGDAEPRVRDAALTSFVRLGDSKGAKAADPGARAERPAWSARMVTDVTHLLEGDPFTFIRGHAADALWVAPASDEADDALGRALADVSPLVRGRAVEALGRRGAKAYASELRDKLDDPEEILDVRLRAARALGRLCDTRSADRLTELARAAASAQPGSPELVIGASAAAALGRLNPPDLAKRLAPLTNAAGSRLAQEVAKMAFGATDRCR